MLDIAIEILKIFEKKGYEAYIVGGFVRDYLMKIESLDIDITTNATPKEIINIFKDAIISKEQYGSITLIYKKIRFEITTYRIDSEYINNRKPLNITYIDSVLKDLKRRDFTINALLINSNKEIIDHFHYKKDILNRIIKTIKDPNISFREDALRMLRAIRFITVLDFDLGDKEKKAIKRNKELIKNLSYFRKKQELDKIFSSKNIEVGIKLIKELDLESVLDIKINNINYVDDIVGIWAQIIYSDNYQFSKNEKEIINKIRELNDKNIMDNKVLYYYGPYITSISAKIKKINQKEILKRYDIIPIKTKNDINITNDEICNILNKEKGSFLKEIYNNITNKILDGQLENDYNKLKEYILKNYK